MNRLKKKCVIGTVGIHLLLLTLLIVGPAFFNPQPKADEAQVLDVIPANLVDAAVNSGVKNAQPPPPAPVQPQPPQPQFAPPPPRIVPPPAPTPTPTFLEKVKIYFTPKPTPSVTPDLTPAEKPVKSQNDNIKINLQKVTRTSVPVNNTANARAINNTIRNLSHSLSSSTTVDMPGNSSASYASYAAVVKSIYERALRSNLPDTVAHNNENTTVKVTIANDGTVVSSEIVSPSGDPAWDNAVQRTLNQVTFIAPFPEGATQKERHYTINFNPQVEQSFE